MVNCTFIGCQDTALYGHKSESAKRCGYHRLGNDVESRRRNQICKFEECTKRAGFGLTGGPVIYCATHSVNLDDAVNVGKKNQFCVYPGCKILASFGLPGFKMIHCSNHADDDEKDLKNTNNKCSECNMTASYGFPGGKIIHCSNHADKTVEIDLRHSSNKCVGDDCEKQASFGLVSDGITKHCFDHHIKGKEVNLLMRKYYKPKKNKKVENDSTSCPEIEFDDGPEIEFDD